MSMNDTTADRPATRRIAAEVRAEMFRQDVSQRDLADRIGWPQPRLARRLTAAVDFRVGELERIAEVLGVPVAQFLAEQAAA